MLFTVSLATLAAVAVGLGAPAVIRTVTLNVSHAVQVDFIVPDDVALAPLPARSRVTAADGSLLSTLHGELDREVVALADVPEHVRQAVLATEDRRFYTHSGYDPEALGRALLTNVRAGGVEQGGSTLTQQLAKLNFAGDQRSLARKATELVYAVALERRFSKDILLERYLNQVYFGGGAYGIAAAAEEYFGVPPSRLRVEQGALLAGLIRAPEDYDPRDHSLQSRIRRNEVLRDMVAAGYLRQSQARALAQRPVGVLPAQDDPVRFPHVVEAVRREFLTLPAFGRTEAERERRLLQGGLQITTTLDPELQGIADDVARRAIAGEGEGGASATRGGGNLDDGPVPAIAVVDPRTGAIPAVHAGASFDSEQYDLALQARRQPGSALKPFVLAAAFAQGKRPGTIVDAPSSVTLDPPGDEDTWTVENFEGQGYGRLSLRDALTNSVNTVFAQLIMEVGTDRVVETLDGAGIDIGAALGSSRFPTLALGGVTHGVTPMELAGAYGVFANGGRRVLPHLIDSVTDATGRQLYRPDRLGGRVLDAQVNADVVTALRSVVQSGTGVAARLPGQTVAGKTGTTQEGADVWFAGFTGDLVATVWMGYPDRRVEMPGSTGGGTAAAVWRDFMGRAAASRKDLDTPERPPRLREQAGRATRRSDEGVALSRTAGPPRGGRTRAAGAPGRGEAGDRLVRDLRVGPA